MPPLKRKSPPERTLHHWLGLVMREHRTKAGLSYSAISGPVNLSDDTLKHFENGENWPGGIDQILASYARALGVKDARTFYSQAITRWRAEGQKPRIENGPTRVADAFQEAGRQPPQAPTARSETGDAT